jgi:putative addiction module component (TIGR02574 family)
MSNERIKKEALELSQKERAQLAHMLIDSLNPESDFESEEAWSKELKHRINQYQKGASSSTSWDNVKKKGLNILNK